VELAGVPMSDDNVFEIARLLRVANFAEVARKLEKGMTLGTKVLGLSIGDRESVLQALDDPPDELAAFRGVLLGEHKGRKKSGLA
jgi:hypothetical protein